MMDKDIWALVKARRVYTDRLETQIEHLRVENTRLREALDAEHRILTAVVTAGKGSMGSLDNVYLPQIDRNRADLAFKAGANALVGDHDQ